MSALFNKLSLKAKIIILVSFFLAGFAIFGGITYFTLEELRVNGPLYAQIVLGKDLVADILPPPEYILESHLITLQLLSAADPAEMQVLVTR
ncbi:MAG TPA: methyl-accepting chemotaxis protein, partial [Bacteroidota bacterium]|nr:methyl-accepting chemotaxis protein [Bacteroidota bacterium]